MRMVSSFLVNFEYVLKSDVDFTKLANVTQSLKKKTPNTRRHIITQLSTVLRVHDSMLLCSLWNEKQKEGGGVS